MAWVNENGQVICSDCNWILQATTPRFSRRHYEVFADMLNHIIDELETVHTTPTRLQAGMETVVFLIDSMCDYFIQDNSNFKEKLFRAQIKQ